MLEKMALTQAGLQPYRVGTVSTKSGNSMVVASSLIFGVLLKTMPAGPGTGDWMEMQVISSGHLPRSMQENHSGA